MQGYAGELFDNMDAMMKRLKKPLYEERMAAFREKHRQILQEMVESVEKAVDRESEAAGIARMMADAVEEKFSKNGKISARKQVDINFFMIYYVFPAILLVQGECAIMLADAIRDEWRRRFKESRQINYADYDTIFKSFREKIFGLF